MKFLLDTNVISEIRKRDRAHPNVVRWVNRTPRRADRDERPDTRRNSAWYRAETAERPGAGKISRSMVFADAGRLGARVQPIDEPVAEAWALMGIPNPLPLIDGFLAATAKVHGLTFVTRNVADIAATGVSLLDPFSGA